MRSTIIVLPILIASLLAFTLSTCSEPAPVRRNVLLITLDTIRADYLSCYGEQNAQTPHLDSLAEAGVLFSRAQSSSAVTPVSHATILTGRLPYEHGLRVIAGGGGFQLEKEQRSMASIFKEAGYQTAAIQSAFPVSRTFGLEQGFDVFQDMDGSFLKSNLAYTAAWDMGDLQRRSDTTTDMALEFIDSAEEPFFLWIHYWDPHDGALIPSKEFMDQNSEKLKRGTAATDKRTAMYALEVEYQDTQIGRLLDGLRDRNLMDDALIATVSDHGEGLRDGLLDHDWQHHGITYQEQLHVPMIISGPNLPKGTIDNRLVSSVDLAPTLLELAGLPTTQGAGKSLLPFAPRPDSDSLRWAYSDQINAFDWNAGFIHWVPKASFLHVVTDGDWKLIYRPHMPFSESEIFHLAEDPAEASNLIADEPKQFRRLAENLAARNPWVFQAFEGEGMGDSGREALANIGYAHLESGDKVNWWWECALHPNDKLESRGRCPIETVGNTCSFPLLPRTDWTLPSKIPPKVK